MLKAALIASKNGLMQTASVSLQAAGSFVAAYEAITLLLLVTMSQFYADLMLVFRG